MFASFHRVLSTSHISLPMHSPMNAAVRHLCLVVNNIAFSERSNVLSVVNNTTTNNHCFFTDTLPVRFLLRVIIA